MHIDDIDVTVVSKTSVGGPNDNFRHPGGNEKQTPRDVRITSWLADERNQDFVPVGRLLATKPAVLGGLSMAEYLIQDTTDEGLTLTTVSSGGVKFALKDGFKVSLKDLKPWGCQVCGSAHGTGVGASDNGKDSGPSVKGLWSNKWYYNPRTQELFTISATCWQKYIVERNVASRFTMQPKAAEKLQAKLARKSA